MSDLTEAEAIEKFEGMVEEQVARNAEAEAPPPADEPPEPPPPPTEAQLNAAVQREQQKRMEAFVADLNALSERHRVQLEVHLSYSADGRTLAEIRPRAF